MGDFVSVIVTTFNEEGYIEKCLLSLRAQSYRDKEIIVVDSESTDRTVEIAKKYADKLIVKKCSIPAGRNIGAKESRGNVLLFVDADVMLNPTWIDTALPYLEDENVVAVYGELFPVEKSVKDKLIFCIFGFTNFFSRTVARKTLYAKLGTAVLIKKWALEKIGYFSEGVCVDDVDCSLRLNRVGRIKFVKQAWGYVSTRRFRRTGYLKLSLIWLISGNAYFLFKKPFILKKYTKNFP
ncbi:MAG: glycosyltransferase [Nitrososphaerota archaeon]|nr:glycosyltransferase [Nitrososphaerota archaeon]